MFVLAILLAGKTSRGQCYKIDLQIFSANSGVTKTKESVMRGCHLDCSFDCQCDRRSFEHVGKHQNLKKKEENNQKQGSLTEGEGSVPLTSSSRQIVMGKKVKNQYKNELI
jgi:hypothetical protein